MTNDQQINERLAQIRRDNFRVEVKDCEYRKGEISVATTHNGFQWQSISLTPAELRALSEEIQKKLQTLPLTEPIHGGD